MEYLKLLIEDLSIIGKIEWVANWSSHYYSAGRNYYQEISEPLATSLGTK